MKVDGRRKKEEGRREKEEGWRRKEVRNEEGPQDWMPQYLL